MKRFVSVMLFLGASSAVFASAVPEAPTTDERTIVDIAVEDGRFTTLVAALEAADLVDTLAAEGPFTVFAPTDEAFAALPAGTVESLLANPEALTNVLTYHVLAGAVDAATVTGLTSATTLQGQPLVVGAASGVTVNQAGVTQADVFGSNGVIHVIDAVLLPPSGTVVDVAVGAGTFSTLVTAVQAAGLVETLSGDGPFTVFAPTDEAFAALPEGTIPALLADIPTLTEVLTYHVVPGRVFSGDVVGLDRAGTVQGSEIAIGLEMGAVVLNGEATVVATDVLATNGVIHVIDAVILPE